jgi:hypothetical protein
MLLCINRGNELGWNSPLIIAFGAVALALAPVLCAVERRAAAPILPPSLRPSSSFTRKIVYRVVFV